MPEPKLYEPDRDAILAALSKYRDEGLADFFVLIWRLAWARHPDVMADGLADGFDLTAVQEYTRRAMAAADQANAYAAEAVRRAREAVQHVGRTEQGVLPRVANLELIERRLEKIARDVQALADQVKSQQARRF